MEAKTPLYERHLAAGGKIVPFAGYLLPVQYPGGVIAEHMAVRTAAGLFDVSHMGEVVFSGAGALAELNRLLTNDYTNLAVGRVRYGVMCYDDGGTVDDLIVYRTGEQSYLVVVNAANRAKDVEWMRGHISPETGFSDISESVAQLALQGPAAQKIIEKVAAPADIPERYYSFTVCTVAGIKCLLSRTGYTGESGFELYCAPADAAALWDKLLDAGSEDSLIPCGLGARDTLRLEAAMPLYGHELSAQIDPVQAGLGFAIKMDKPDFIGKQGILARPAGRRRRAGLKVTGRGIVREHCDIFDGDRPVGASTSGTFCPKLNGAYAMAMLEPDCCEPGRTLSADVRGRKIEVEVVPLPFYKKEN